MFEIFKSEIRNLNVNELSKELQKRKELMFLWNKPNERKIDVELAGKAGFKSRSKHPYYKVRKEIAIINTFIHQIELISGGNQNGRRKQ